VLGCYNAYDSKQTEKVSGVAAHAVEDLMKVAWKMAREYAGYAAGSYGIAMEKELVTKSWVL
jgi:hypothetical protein